MKAILMSETGGKDRQACIWAFLRTSWPVHIRRLLGRGGFQDTKRPWNPFRHCGSDESNKSA